MIAPTTMTANAATIFQGNAVLDAEVSTTGRGVE
jgi:hypothetical protein